MFEACLADLRKARSAHPHGPFVRDDRLECLVRIDGGGEVAVVGYRAGVMATPSATSWPGR